MSETSRPVSATHPEADPSQELRSILLRLVSELQSVRLDLALLGLPQAHGQTGAVILEQRKKVQNTIVEGTKDLIARIEGLTL